MNRVAVLKGGRSLERHVSLKSGARVEEALRRLGHEVLPIDVDIDLVSRLSAAAPEAAFVALHGRGGEDGTVQELLEALGIPYTGSRGTRGSRPPTSSPSARLRSRASASRRRCRRSRRA
jgi:D-alanine-D-alanine ligase